MVSKSTIYSRGWETFAHWLLMLRVSIMRNVLWAAFLSVVLAGIWFAVSLGDQGRSSFAKYAFC
ncbi:MAG: hypothetical protein KJ621_21215, partial [Proteobacteria bacterium]|nr:hypothetical protein [Pseudomonadota bacterium]